MAIQTLTLRFKGTVLSISFERQRARESDSLPAVSPRQNEHRAAYRHPDAVLEANISMPLRR